MAKPKQQTNEADALATALGLSHKDFTIDGELITVRKFKLKAMAPVYDVLAQLNTSVQSATMDAGQMITLFPNLAAQLISHATGQPVEWVDDLEIEDAGDLLAATMEINSRFFTGEAMARMFTSLAGTLAPAQTTAETTSPS